MARFPVRLVECTAATTDLALPEVEDQGFTDVTEPTYTAEQVEAVNVLGTLEVTTGTGDGTTYSPQARVTRRDMASFLNRIQGLLAEQLGADAYATGDRFFADVGAGLDRAGDINALAGAGIVEGTDTVPNHRPFEPVLRSQMALLLMRHVDENVAAGVLPALGAPDVDEPFVTITSPTDGDLVDVEHGAEAEVVFETNVEVAYPVSVSPGTDPDVGPDGFEEIASGDTTPTETTATVDVPAVALAGPHALKIEDVAVDGVVVPASSTPNSVPGRPSLSPSRSRRFATASPTRSPRTAATSTRATRCSPGR